MTTPRIEEMVGGLKRKYPCIVTDKMAIGNQSDLYIDLFSDIEQSLTQAHQAGVQEAIHEWNKAEQRLDGTAQGAINCIEQFRYTIKALQDNK